MQSRLYSDAPKCLFLSSGTDSSLIASIISKELNVDIPCITMGFKNQYDESIDKKDPINIEVISDKGCVPHDLIEQNSTMLVDNIKIETINGRVEEILYGNVYGKNSK